jgi:hypothetical protein
MKIIKVDNFDKAGPGGDDMIIAENVHEYYGPKIVEWLIEIYSDGYSPDYFRLVEDDYKLRKFEP